MAFLTLETQMSRFVAQPECWESGGNMRALGVGVLLSRSRVRDWEEEKKNGRQKHFF